MAKQPAKLGEAEQDALRRALATALRGEVRFDATTWAAYSSDSSNYRQVPVGVVFPVDQADVEATARLVAEAGATLWPGVEAPAWPVKLAMKPSSWTCRGI